MAAILPANVGDLTTQETLAAEFLYLLAASGDGILNHPAVMFASAPNPSSNVVRVPHLGLRGTDILSATTPGSDVSATSLTDGSTDVTIAMRALRYQLDDLARWMVGGRLDAAAFAQAAVISINQTVVDLLANVCDDFTATAGSSGVDLAWSDIVSAKTALGVANASGPMCAILHPQQWGDLESDALSLGALPAAEPGMSGVISAGLGSYKGRFMGIDFFVSSRVPTANAGADRAGALFTRGAVAVADAMMPDQGDENILSLGRGQFERVREGLSVSTSYMISHACGVAQAIDAAGVSIISDA